MKRLFTLFILILSGCSGPTGNSGNPPPPEWVAIIQPGKFIGVWKQGKVVANCTSFVTEADSVLDDSTVNDSTGEVLFLCGQFPVNGVDFLPGRRPYFHSFYVIDSSSFYGDTDVDPVSLTDANCAFSYNTDTVFYFTKRGNDSISIVCVRQN